MAGSGTAHVEVGPDGYGGWKVVVIYQLTERGTVDEVLARPRLKRTALKKARAYAKKNNLEMRVKNAKGQYTTAASSHGNDPESSKG